MRTTKHKKSSPILGSKENFAKHMISFIENKSEINRRTILQIFENMSSIDLTKISISKLKNPTLLYIITLNELMSRIEKNKIVFRVTSVFLCAQMIAETARMFLQHNDNNLSMFNLILSDKISIKIPSENEVSTFPTRKNQKIHSYSPLLAFIIKHYPAAGNIKDVFSYSLAIILERMGVKSLTPILIPQFPPEKYALVPRQKFECSNITQESLLEIANRLKSPMDPILVLLIRFISCKLLGSYDFHYIHINGLIDTIFEFLEEDPEFSIDGLTPLLLYYTSQPVNYPIHLTYTSVNHCLFLVCLGFANLFEPTTNDILLQTLSFENAPCPSLALAFAHNLTTSFIPEFISTALKNNLTPEWDEEIKYLLQYAKLPPKREDLVEQSKTNNIDAIKLLLKDPDCLPLLKPDEFQSHKLLSLFLKPIEFPLPEKINFERYDAAFIYRLKSLKDKPDEKIIGNYINQAALMLNKITMKVSNNDKTLFHAFYSGLQPKQAKDDIPEPLPISSKRMSSAEFFFLPPNSQNEFENISIIIENLIAIIFLWKFNFGNDKLIIQNLADFNCHHFISINDSDRCTKLFGNEYSEVLERRPFHHFILAIQESDDKQKWGDIISIFMPIFSLPISQSSLCDFINQCYHLKNEEFFLNIIKLLPSISFLESSTMTKDELLDIIKILINSNTSKNVIQISTKLIDDGFSKEVFGIFLSESIKHPSIITSICTNLKKVGDFADFFFNNSLELIPSEIDNEFSSLLLFLSQLVKPSEHELPTYLKLRKIESSWKEDKLVKEGSPKTELGTEISITADKPIKKSKISTTTEAKKPKKESKKGGELVSHHHEEDILNEEAEEEDEEEEELLMMKNCLITASQSQVHQRKSKVHLNFHSRQRIAHLFGKFQT